MMKDEKIIEAASSSHFEHSPPSVPLVKLDAHLVQSLRSHFSLPFLTSHLAAFSFAFHFKVASVFVRA